MAKFNIESVLKKFTDSDGNVDYTGANEELQTQTNNIVAKESAKNKPDDSAIIQKFLNDNEFKNIDEFNAFKKSGATADSEAVKRLEGELATIQTTVKEVTADKETLTQQLSTYKNTELIRGSGVNLNDDYDVDYYQYKIGKVEGETFEEKLANFKESSPKHFEVKEPKQNVLATTGKPINRVNTNDGLTGYQKILAEKDPNYARSLGIDK